jgi:hypothetical protein
LHDLKIAAIWQIFGLILHLVFESGPDFFPSPTVEFELGFEELLHMNFSSTNGNEPPTP